MLKQQYNYKLKFIVSLRDPIGRTISSWKFKAKEGLMRNGLFPDDYFNVTMMQGIDQANCVIACYDKTKDMRKCSWWQIHASQGSTQQHQSQHYKQEGSSRQIFADLDAVIRTEPLVGAYDQTL